MENSTSNESKDTKNLRVLVNFKKRKVLGMRKHYGSPEMRLAREKGYELVGTVNSNGELFASPEFFDYTDKYPGNNEAIITT